MTCSKCGTALPAGIKFCPTCGAAVSEPSHEAQLRGSLVKKNTISAAPVAPAAPAAPAYAEPVPAYAPPAPAYAPPAPAYAEPAPAYAEPVYAAPQVVYVTAPAPTVVVKKKSHGFLAFLITTVLLAAVAFGVLWYLGFFKSDEEKIRDRISAFESSYNSGDWNGVASCFSTKVNSAMGIAGGASIGGSYGGLSGSASLSQMFGLGVGMTGTSIGFDIHEIEITGDTATVTATMTMSSMGYTETDDGIFYMVKSGSDWLIQDMK